MAVALAAILTLAVPTDPYIQDGYNPPEGYESHQDAVDEPEPAKVEQSAVEPSVNRGMGNGTSDVEQWRPLVAGHWPAEQVENALCMIRSESGGNPNAKNPNSEARGLAQVMSSVWGPYFGFSHADFYIPELNLYAAAAIWRGEGGSGGGWKPWSPRTRRNCNL